MSEAAESNSRADVPSTRDMEGMIAIVTGGGGGIGSATIRALEGKGARAISLDVEGAPANGTLSLNCDVTDLRSVKSAVAQVHAAFGGLDVVINNAGVRARGTVSDYDDNEWRRVLDINVTGMARVMAASLPHLRVSRAPSVVNTCSVSASIGMFGLVLYTATKGAVLAMTRAMAADHLADGIRVNSVSPGTTDTPWVGRLVAAAEDPGRAMEEFAARQPHRRLVKPEEVADAIAFLASPRSGSTTGVDLLVDGGINNLRLMS